MSTNSRQYVRIFFTIVFITAAAKNIYSHDLLIGMIFLLGGAFLGWSIAREYFKARHTDISSSKPL